MIDGLASTPTMIRARLNAYRGWTGAIPTGWRHAGILLCVIWRILFSWGAVFDPFFSKGATFQERYQTVNRAGNCLIRYPQYLGDLSRCISQLLRFGWWWAFLPAVLTIPGSTVRAVMADKTL